MLVLQIIVLVVLSLIFYQDMQQRSVYWFMFPILTVLFVLIRAHNQYPAEIEQSTLINIGFEVLLVILLSTYFSIKNKRWINITQELLGIGDIVFLFSISFYLSVLNYYLFFMVSLLGIIFFRILVQGRSAKKMEPVPLAGLQALLLLCCLSGSWFFKFFDLSNDSWLLKLITP